jgi:hypothetical protein
MKRIAKFIPLLVCLIFGLSRAGIIGDFNDDGSINIADVVVLLLSGMDNPNDPKVDFNGDGKYSITDAVALIIYIKSLNGEELLEFSDVALTNHTGTAFVISWRTNRPTSENLVLYGYDPSNLNEIGVDSTTVTQQGRIHYVQLVFLDPDTTYYYRIRSDGLEYSVAPDGVDSVLTFPQSLSTTRLFLEGRVTDQAGQALEKVLVRSFLKWNLTTVVDSSMWYTVPTDPDGTFWMELANYRRYNGSPVVYSPNQTWLHLHILGLAQETLRDSILLTGPYEQVQPLGTFMVP